jgi:hypothetical protein
MPGNRTFPPPGVVILQEQTLKPARPVTAKTKLLAAAAGAAAPPTYQVLTTSELDAYEKPKPLAMVLAAKKKPPKGDNYAGTSRKAAKISLSGAAVETFKTLTALHKKLPAEKTMAALKPKITTEASSGRRKQEERNVKVRAHLYAASREDDNDFHLIIGLAPDAAKELYMNVEVSGLPPKSSAAFAALAAARQAFKAFFGKKLPGMTYDFYKPPIPVEIEGSLFFDVNHLTGGRPGPESLRNHIPTVWEIHPISRIVFEP